MKGDLVSPMSIFLVLFLMILIMLISVLGWFDLNDAIDTNMKLRTASWIAHRLSGNPDCLSSGVVTMHTTGGGTLVPIVTSARKNVLSKSKINAAVSTLGDEEGNHPCAPIFCYSYRVQIADYVVAEEMGNEYEPYSFGSTGDDTAPEHFVLPVSIKDGEEVHHGVMVVSAGYDVESTITGYQREIGCQVASLMDGKFVFGTEECEALGIDLTNPIYGSMCVGVSGEEATE